MSHTEAVYTLAELGVLCDAQVVGDPSHAISGVNTLEDATSSDASFLANPRYLEAMKGSNAGVICIDRKTELPQGKNFLLTDDPCRAFQIIAEHFITTGTSGFQGIHPTAVIHPEAIIDPSCTIGPNCSIDRGTKIGPNTHIFPNVSIGFGVEIGSDCTIHPNCVIRERCRIGNRVILQPGAIIGSCGFGYTPDKFGRHIKLEQLGIVILEDDVEIGANTTIDRARFKATIIHKGTKIDNLVQIGHNVEVGEHNIIAAQTGMAGSSKTGKYVMLGGQVGIVGHVELDDQVMIATRGGVSKSLKTGKYRGSPAVPLEEYNREVAYIRKLKEIYQRLKDLEKKFAD